MMTPEIPNEELPASPPKRRKLKHPRTAKACSFCRRRKVRCSGTHPCDYCKNEGVECDFEDDLVRPPNRNSTSTGALENVPESSSIPQDAMMSAEASIQHSVSRPSRRNSVDLSQAFAAGQLIDPTSGVSLLYHLQNKAAEEVQAIPSASLATHGDVPQAVSATVNAFPLPAADEVTGLLERYFRFAMPTYRFLHRPTLEEWAKQLTGGEYGLVPKVASRSACALLACAQALLYTHHGDMYPDGGETELRRSRQYYARAKNLLEHKPGPANLSSVQARLAMCLYLLSTFRITECRFCSVSRIPS